ncbi:MAG: c-type cytochrome biogenesis protein CcmI [Pseudomonadota bacterium]
MTFWIIAVAIVAIAAIYIALPLIRREEDAAPRAAHDVQVFKDQLAELERDVGRGTVSREDADATKLEISRRLLAADAELREAENERPAPKTLSRALAALVVFAVPAASIWVYFDVGAPGVQDAPFAERREQARPSQQEAEEMLADRDLAPPVDDETVAEFSQLVEQLEARLAVAPDDEQGVFLYARSLMNLGRFADAWPQFEKLIELRNDRVEADVYAGYSEAMILAAGGYISPEAEDALLQVLKREPTNPSARYYLGHLHAQAGDPQLAESVWVTLLQESPPGAPWVQPIRAELNRLGLGPRGGDGLPGPTQDELAAAQNIPPQDQQAMVADMVGRLADRLAAQGGSVAEWRRLIRSYSVLGDAAKAQEAMANARAAFANDPAALAALDAPDELPAAPPQAGGGFGLPPVQGGTQGGALPGPDQDDIAAASEMDEVDRAAMIEGMVSRLRERLEVEGGAPEEWLRLISSLNVMGRQGEARAAYESARRDFEDDPRALAMLESAVEGAPRSAQPGPTEEDVANARDMAPEDRAEMIRGMVGRLHDRLREEGRAADVNDWGQLMRSYRVLEEQDAVRAAYEEAIQIYDDDDIGLAYLKEAALLNGVVFE